MAIRKVIPRSLDSAAASANLSFDANTLFVDSTNNVVGINTATPNSFATGLAVYNATNPSVAIVSGNANAYLRLYSTSDSDMYLSNTAGKMTFTTAATARMTIDSSGNVGIGTTSPTIKFQVSGSIGNLNNSQTVPTPDNGSVPVQLISNNYSNGSGETNFWNTAASITGGIRLMQVTGSGTYNDMAWFQKNAALFYTGNTERMRITSAGNVCVNNTGAITTEAFQVKTLSTLGGTAGNQTINTSLYGPDTSNTTRLEFKDVRISTGTSHATSMNKIQRRVDGTDMGYISLSSNGNSNAVVGFGIGTTEWARFDDNGNFVVNATTALGKVTVSDSAAETKLSINNTGTSGRHYWIGSTNDSSGAVGGGKFAIYDQTANAARLVIDSSGKVGIGTTSPTNKLHVVGTAKIEGSTLDLNDAGTFTISQNTSSSALVIRTAASSYMRFDTGGSNERMRIADNGNVGIGTSSTPDRFNVSGNATITDTLTVFAQPSSTQQGVQFRNTFNVGPSIFSTGTATTNGFINWVGGNGTQGSVVGNGSGITYNTTSDYRLKENVAPMTGALATVAKLRPVTYNWKVDGADGQGFIAHELEAIFPDAVSGEKDGIDKDGNPEYQGIDTSYLVATLTAAIQEQQVLIAQLQADVAALQAK